PKRVVPAATRSPGRPFTSREEATRHPITLSARMAASEVEIAACEHKPVDRAVQWEKLGFHDFLLSCRYRGADRAFDSRGDGIAHSDHKHEKHGRCKASEDASSVFRVLCDRHGVPLVVVDVRW